MDQGRYELVKLMAWEGVLKGERSKGEERQKRSLRRSPKRVGGGPGGWKTAGLALALAWIGFVSE